MEILSTALSLWKVGLVNSEELIAWVDAHIGESENPNEILVNLSLDGPDACLKRPVYDFPPRPIELTFIDEFGLRVSGLDLSATPRVHSFIKWATTNCFGENLDDPAVIFCYQLEDISTLGEQVDFLYNQLPPLIPQSQSVADFFFSHVPGLKPKGTE